MQGLIFTAFADMVTERLGMASWNTLLEETNPPSGGCYTSGHQYDDAELIQMVALLSEKSDIPVNQLLQQFGAFLFPRLMVNSPEEVKRTYGLKPFLLMIDSVIHAEVQRVHPDAYLPKFTYDDSKPDCLVMYYSSKRQLCDVACGLISGAATYFGETILIEHPECMHHGAEQCKFIIHFEQ